MKTKLFPVKKVGKSKIFWDSFRTSGGEFPNYTFKNLCYQS